MSASLFLPSMSLSYRISSALGLPIYLAKILSKLRCSVKIFLPNPSFPLSHQVSDLRHGLKALPAASTPISFIFHWHFPDKSLAHLIPSWCLLLESLTHQPCATDS